MMMYHTFFTEVLSIDAICRDGTGQISRMKHQLGENT
jgi:hypothetical protein